MSVATIPPGQLMLAFLPVAAMIPVSNSLLAVGSISLPGMMAGQILSGVAPFIAARYQIMVMGVIFGATGISSACFLSLTRDRITIGCLGCVPTGSRFPPGRPSILGSIRADNNKGVQHRDP